MTIRRSATGSLHGSNAARARTARFNTGHQNGSGSSSGGVVEGQNPPSGLVRPRKIDSENGTGGSTGGSTPGQPPQNGGPTSGPGKGRGRGPRPGVGG